jgi:sentrin-specific protease 1
MNRPRKPPCDQDQFVNHRTHRCIIKRHLVKGVRGGLYYMTDLRKTYIPNHMKTLHLAPLHHLSLVLASAPAPAPAPSTHFQLSTEDQNRVQDLWNWPDEDRVNDHNHIMGRDIKTLAVGEWLNDEVINTYCDVLNFRSAALRRRVYCFNTQMMVKLFKHDPLDRWITKQKINLCKLDTLLFPTHVNRNHWVLVHVDRPNKMIRVLDSLGTLKLANFSSQIASIKTFLMKQGERKWNGKDETCESDFADMKVEFPVPKTGKTQYPQSIPKQTNSVDCGVFTCFYMNYISLNKPWDFTQQNTEAMRQRLTLDVADYNAKAKP